VFGAIAFATMSPELAWQVISRLQEKIVARLSETDRDVPSSAESARPAAEVPLAPEDPAPVLPAPSPIGVVPEGQRMEPPAATATAAARRPAAGTGESRSADDSRADDRPAEIARPERTAAPEAATPPPPAAPNVHPVRVGGNIRVPAKVRDVRPVYPQTALSSRVQGLVIIEATIGADGRVRETRVLRSVPLLDDAALDAVRQWEYEPTLLNGAPVPVIMTVTVNFRLQ
jgi:protein TonB